jgi:hypothetical protein
MVQFKSPCTLWRRARLSHKCLTKTFLICYFLVLTHRMVLLHQHLTAALRDGSCVFISSNSKGGRRPIGAASSATLVATRDTSA